MKNLLYLILLLMFFNIHCSKEHQPLPSNNIDKVFDDYFREYLNIYPELGTSLGLTKEMGYEFRKDVLNDESEPAIENEYALLRKYNELLKSYDRKTLTPSQKLDADILAWQIDVALDGYKFRYNDYLINPMDGVHQRLVTLFTEYHSIDSKQSALDYIARLEKVNIKLDQILSRVKLQVSKGIIPSASIINYVESGMSDFIAVNPQNNLFYTSFKSRVDVLNDIDSNTKQELYQKVESIISEKIYPSYKRFMGELKLVSIKADENIGCWKLPAGDKYYQYCLHKHTSTNLTPDEIHQLGIKEVARIQSEIKILLDSLGVENASTTGERLDKYREFLDKSPERDKFYYPENDESKYQVIKDYQSIIDDTWDKLPTVFSVIPKMKVHSKHAPKHKGGTAYYEAGSLDGKRAGTFYVNEEWIPMKTGMATLTYHEAIPGHHFQIAIQQEMPNNRIFKSLYFIPGFGEGWALYAERLAKEQGWFPDIYSRLGYLSSELFRAVRLVVDTGIHQQRWTGNQAYQYMVDNMGWGSYGEIGRYSVWAGQACAYKIGELKIIELREKARKKLGDKFDIKEFHKVALQKGSVPLELLEKLVDEYIQQNQ